MFYVHLHFAEFEYEAYPNYSWRSLSRPRLSRISAYLEVKILSLPKHVNLTTGKKIMWKRGESNFSFFPQYFQYISNFKSPITYIHLINGCSNYFFLNSANLICRGTDISKYFRGSLGIRDNESDCIRKFKSRIHHYKCKTVKCLLLCLIVGVWEAMNYMSWYTTFPTRLRVHPTTTRISPCNICAG